MIGETVNADLADSQLMAELTEVIENDARAKGKPLVVAFYGESGSGKSVTAKALMFSLQAHGKNVVRLQMDDYFFLPPSENSAEREGDLSRVGPREVDLEMLDRHLKELKVGADEIRHPVIDFKNNTRIVERLCVPTPLDFILVEGTYVNLLSQVDLRVFLERTFEETHIHRVARMREPDSDVLKEVLKIEHQIVLGHRSQADHVISKDFRLLR